jgi:alkyl sulfatase BDS1-like metallo-beta-lactamase superfamily hydrolase
LLAELAGGNDRLLGKARELVDQGELQLALELLDSVVRNQPDSAEAHELMAKVYITMGRTGADLNWYHRAAYFNAARKARQAAAPAQQQ